MDFPMIPSYLIRIAPGYYAHRVTRQCVVLEPYQVEELYWQEIQQWHAQQQFGINAGPYAVPFQQHAPIAIANNFGPINTGSSHLIDRHPGHRGQFHTHHVHAGGRVNSGTAEHAPASVPGFGSSFTPAPVPRLQTEIIDLTEDSWVPAPVAVPLKPAPTKPATPRPAPASRAKPNRSFWKKGSAYIKDILKSESGSNAWRLFESMSAVSSSDQKYRYCEGHWPNEQAAFEDIREMSRYFIDASDMLMYALKWDSVNKLSNLEDPSNQSRVEKERLEKDIANEKAALMLELPKKKMRRMEEEQYSRWVNWVSNMSREKFRETFDRKLTAANLEKVLTEERERSAKEKAQRAERLAKLKRKATAVPVEARAASKKPKARGVLPTAPMVVPNSEPAMQVDEDVDALGETDNESVPGVHPDVPVIVSGNEPAREAALHTDREVDDESVPATPPTWTTYEEDMEDAIMEAFAGTSTPILERPSNIRSPHSERTEENEEQIAALTSVASPEPMAEKPVIPADEKAPSISSPLAAQYLVPYSPTASPRKEHTVVHSEVRMEQVIASDSPPKDAVRRDSVIGPNELLTEQATAPTLANEHAPQEENTVVANEISDADLNDLFEDDEAPEDLPAATAEEIEAPQVSEDLPAPLSPVAAPHSSPLTPPTASDFSATDAAGKVDSLQAKMSEEEIAALTARGEELKVSRAEIFELLAEIRTKIAEKEVIFQSLIRNLRNPYFKVRMQGKVPNKEIELREFRDELEGFEQDLREVEWELAVFPVVAEREI